MKFAASVLTTVFGLIAGQPFNAIAQVAPCQHGLSALVALARVVSSARSRMTHAQALQGLAPSHTTAIQECSDAAVTLATQKYGAILGSAGPERDSAFSSLRWDIASLETHLRDRALLNDADAFLNAQLNAVAALQELVRNPTENESEVLRSAQRVTASFGRAIAVLARSRPR